MVASENLLRSNKSLLEGKAAFERGEYEDAIMNLLNALEAMTLYACEIQEVEA